MPKTLLQTLRDTRAIIADPEHWTQGQYAVDQSGHYAPLHSGAAHAFCLLGAFARAEGRADDSPASDNLIELYRRFRLGRVSSPAIFNDTSTHDQVLAKLDEIIVKLESETSSVPADVVDDHNE